MIENYISTAKSNYLEFEYFKKNVYSETLKLEGGSKLHKVSEDSGGWTKYGISYENNRHLFVDLEHFKSMSYDEASAIAYCLYYLPLKCDKLRLDVKLDVFDMSFNLGTTQTIRLVQRYYGLKEDGILGAKTLQKLLNIDSQTVYKIRVSFYYRLVKSKKKLNKFLSGWLNRAKYILNG